MTKCLFCNIIAGETKAEVMHRDDRATAFVDITAQAPTHLLVVPNKHIVSLAQAEQEDEGLLGHLLLVGADLARQRGLDSSGFRTVINTGADAGQTVFHIHVHILGGRRMGWPPG